MPDQASRPFWDSVPARTIRQGHFWTTGERVRVTGNGHGLIYEKNSDEVLQPVLDWVERQVGHD